MTLNNGLRYHRVKRDTGLVVALPLSASVSSRLDDIMAREKQNRIPQITLHIVRQALVLKISPVAHSTTFRRHRSVHKDWFGGQRFSRAGLGWHIVIYSCNEAMLPHEPESWVYGERTTLSQRRS